MSGGCRRQSRSTSSRQRNPAAPAELELRAGDWLVAKLRGTPGQPAHFKVGALEGMIPSAARFCRDLQRGTEIQVVQLDIEDLSRLDERFVSGELDVIFTFRLPSQHRKFRYLREIGYQTIDEVGDRSGIPVLSTWEFGKDLAELRDGPGQRALVSNSLAVRDVWLGEGLGYGTHPSPVTARKPRTSKLETVYIVGADRMNPRLWKKIEAIPIRLQSGD